MDKLTLKKPIFLCGMMGSGKSTVGRKVAGRLDVPFKDLDDMIVDKAGMPIPRIFEERGEPGFRELEREILIRESQYFKGVMALGGGSLQNQHIIDHLKIYGWLVFLDVPQSVISQRISGDSNRPMLAADDPSENPDEDAVRTRIQRLMDERRAYYQQSEITITAGDRTADDIAHELIKKLTLYDGFNRR